MNKNVIYLYEDNIFVNVFYCTNGNGGTLLSDLAGFVNCVTNLHSIDYGNTSCCKTFFFNTVNNSFKLQIKAEIKYWFTVLLRVAPRQLHVKR